MRKNFIKLIQAIHFKGGEILLTTIASYFLVSIGVYIFVLCGMCVLVELFKVDKVVSYVLIYVSAYFLEYTMTLTIVFQTDHSWRKVAKFLIHTIAFLVGSTELFRQMLDLGVGYLLSTIFVAILLLPIRYLSNKYFVYS